MTKVKAILVDDSDQARKLLRLMLAELDANVEIVGEADHLDAGVKLIREMTPDVVFLDIEMPGKSGLQILEELPREEVDYDIVFTTAYNDYALKAFRLSAVDYLLKPIDKEQLKDAIGRIRNKTEKKELRDRLGALGDNLKKEKSIQKLALPVQSGYEFVHLHEIEFMEADGSYVHIRLTDGKSKTISKNLKYFEQALEGQSDFVRVHRSFVINLKHMKVFSRSGRGTILMNSGKQIDLARDRREDFLKLL
jgi:two-component system LytT family response regulator